MVVDVCMKVDLVDSVEFVKDLSCGYVIVGVVFNLLSHVLFIVGTSIQNLALEDVEKLYLMAFFL